ncbi:MAG: 23S rRNA (adenine(2503)-C(2))-methyltransferase RlmN [Culturomica sp.]|jgi:23S rRNA (adenine2503-C2)-methyltransferase|nr:23S rRNA (adenine(2503)-C(2))-methyltransferase RlmN [Culturomica sp.]
MNEPAPDIRELSAGELESFLKANGEQAFRSKQIRQWLWQKGVRSFEEMTNLSQACRKLLADHFSLPAPEVAVRRTAADGTVKTAWNLADGWQVESVLIPGKEKHTVCLSSQVGCPLGCTFCATGGLGFKRNLTVGEIFFQVTDARKEAEQQGSLLSNIVLMGMGEPLLNYANVRTAIDHLTDPTGLGMSPSRITLSTAGLPDQIRRLADDGVRFHLAVSLHSAREEVRSRLMPVNRKYPLAALAESLKYFTEHTGTRPTFEYLLLQGINDSLEDARLLAEYCRQFPVKINIIEYNSVEGSAFRPSSEKQRDAFVRFLESRNMVVNIRRSKGKEIDAACGQLANKQK